MTVLFNPIPNTFVGAPAGGSGTVVQWTYTVPAGKRAILEHSFVQVNGNGNAANTTFARIQVVINAVVIQVNALNGSGVAATSFLSLMHHIDLNAGDTVQGYSVNTGAGAVSMQISTVIREYL